MSNTPERESAEQQLASVAEALGVPESTVETTRARLTELRSEPELENRPIAVVGSAILSITCREDGLPITVSDIANAWSRTLPDGSVEPDQLTSLFGIIASKLNMQGTPSQPRALIERYGKDLDLPDSIIVVANRILVDIFSQDAETIADDTSPDVTAGAILYIAARVNGHDDVSVNGISDIMGTSQFAVQSRSKEFRDMLGKERLANDSRYHLPAGAEPEPTQDRPANRSAESVDGGDASAAEASEQVATDAEDATAMAEDAQAEEAAASDAESAAAEAEDETADDPDEAADEEPAGDADAVEGDVEAVVQSLFPDELPTTDTVAEELDAELEDAEAALQAAEADGDIDRKPAGSTTVWVPGEEADLTPDLTEDAVQKEVDELVAALGLDASLRVFARGLVSDAVESLDVEDASEMGGAVVLAASRIQDVDVTAADVAAAGDFEPRVLHAWLDELAETIDLEIPRPDVETYVDRLVAELGLDDEVRDETLHVLEQYEPRESDPSFTAPELAAGAMLFAATVGGAAVDSEELSEASGADSAYVTEAMNSILVSLCLALVTGDLDYDEIDWTADLLALDLADGFGDAETQSAIVLAKTYAAGREADTVDQATIDALLAE
jgi:transcription initiation factor TFIIIB Brf1 subunit/transcription initiation factor TFIIB